jgi:anti-anti-sigma factor
MARHCDLLAGRTDKGYVVRVQGSGTSAHSPALRDFVMECFERDPTETVTVDLLGCDYLDSTFLGCLLRLQRAGKQTRFQVVADETARQRLLAATKLDSYLTLIPVAPASATTFLRIDAKPRTKRELGQHIMETHEALAEVPSDVSSAFREIAAKLKSELEKQDRQSPGMADTVVMRIPPGQ